MEIDCSDDEYQSDYGDHFVGLTDMVAARERENPPSGGVGLTFVRYGCPISERVFAAIGVWEWIVYTGEANDRNDAARYIFHVVDYRVADATVKIDGKKVASLLGAHSMVRPSVEMPYIVSFVDFGFYGIAFAV